MSVVLTAVLAVLLSAVTVPEARAGSEPPSKVWTPPNTKLAATKSVEGGTDPGELGASADPRNRVVRRWSRIRKPVPTGTATITLPHAPGAGRKAAAIRAGRLPVSIADLGAAKPVKPTRSAASAKPAQGAEKIAGRAASGATADAPTDAGTTSVSVTVSDPAKARAAGAFGNLITVRGASPAAESGRAVRVELDVTTLQGTGAWRDRARLVRMPACALTTPERAGCRTRTPVPSTLDPLTGKLTADVTLPATGATGTGTTSGARRSYAVSAASGAMVLSTEPASSGSGGSFAATPLSPSMSWSAGSNAGNFTYSYTFSMPTAIGGAAPSVMLGYDSSTVDGMTAASNSQASWTGEGWAYTPGFISRQYKPCLKAGIDMSGDECWAGQTLSLNLAGHSGQVVKDDTTGVLRLQGDDGTKITPLTGLNNGAWNGEGFKVTTTEGTEYYFGANHLPGGDGTDPASNSVNTVPVYHPKAGDPCYGASTGPASWCQMGWQWNLDYIVDLHGNLISYAYDQEDNWYARGGGQNNGTGARTKYQRASQPRTVSYGQRLPEQVAAKGGLKPAVVMTFKALERCFETTGCEAADRTLANQSRWKDTPLDQNCASGGTCTVYGPTFWTSKRLAEVKADVLVGSGYRTVDTWTLTHGWSYPEDGTNSPTMWLQSIKRTGSNGMAALDLPPVSFTGTQKPNRVDEVTATASRFYRPRMTEITTETGGRINIGYRTEECSRKNGTMPASPENNYMACMPVKWVKPGSPSNAKPELDWFTKYLVNSITQESRVTSGVARVTEYEYGGGAAWHRNDSEFADDEARTYDNFRGYATVTTTTGNGTDGPKSKSVATFLRGMGGQVTDTWGGTLTDEEEYAGFVRETQTFESVAPGARVLSGELSTPWRSEPTSTHTPSVAGLPKVTARFVNTSQVRERARLADGTWRETKREVSYDLDLTHAARVLKVDVFGDVTKPEQRQCTETTYASGANPLLVELPSRVLTLAGPCGATPNAANTIADTRNLFDNQPLGTVGDRALQTSNEVLSSYGANGSPNYRVTAKATFDKYGRQVSTTDPNTKDATHPDGATTTTAYTPAEGALPTSVAVTNPLGWTSTTTMDPGRGLPTRAVDENGRFTDEEYDSLGRLVAVWKPGRDKATQSPNQKFAYALKLERDGPAAITTQNLREDGSYGTSIQIHDGFGRVRQTQAQPPFGSVGRLVADAIFDTQGREVQTTPSYFNNDSGPTAVVFVPQDAQIPAQTWNEYDALGRVTVSKFVSYGQEQWRSTTTYAGADRIDVTPPPGGYGSSSITDALGRTTEVRQYKANTPTGAYDATTTSYDIAGRPVLRKDSSGHEWRYTYDLLGQSTGISDPDSGESRNTYDAGGRVTTTTDARGRSTSFTYDLLGRQTATYEGTDTSDPAKKTIEWTYDAKAKGKPDSSTRFVNGAAYKSTVNGYDIGYRPTGASVNIPASEGAIAGTYTTSVTYTPVLGLPKTTTMPAAGGMTAERVTNSYDVDGNFIGSSGKSALVTDVQYDSFGRPTRTTVGPYGSQVVSTQLYDAGTGRVTQSTLDSQLAGNHVDFTTYTYNKAGTLTSSRNVQDGTSVDTQCFTYDYLGRLSAAWTDNGGTTTAPAPSVSGIGGCVNPTEPTAAEASARIGGPAPYWQSYGYDLTGNRTKLVRHDPTGVTAKDQTVDQTFATGPNTPTTAPDTGGGTGGPHALATSKTTVGTDVRTATYQYDASGNTTAVTSTSGTKRLTWNTEGRIDSVSDTATAGSTSYVYDASGSQLIRRSPGKVTLYVGADEVTLDSATGALSDTRTYPAPGGLSVTRVTKTGTSKLYYQAADPHGTNGVQFEAGTLAVARRPSDPFGNARGTQPGAGAWAGSRGFVGGTLEDTGFTTLGARQYDPATGRFLSVDPIFSDGDPQSWNSYAYADNNPVDQSDSSGTCIPADDGSGRCMSAAAWQRYYEKEDSGSGGTGGGSPTDTGTTPSTQQAKNDNTAKQAAAAEALRQKQAADEALAKAKQEREELMSKIVDVVGDLIGFNDARDCFTKGDVMGCINTALNFVPWSKVFKAVKVGIRAFKLWKEGEKAYDAFRGAQKIAREAEGALVTARKTADEAAAAEDAAVAAEKQAAEKQAAEEAAKAEPDAAPAAIENAEAGASCPIGGAPHSFPAGTRVQLADGTTKSIEEVKEGDQVLATDPQTGKTRTQTVERLITTPDDKEFTDLTLTSADGKSSSLTTTWHHPFWDATARRWTEASTLTSGHELRAPDGTPITITHVRNYHHTVVTYDLTVDSLHTYYVLAGEISVLVHNCGGAVGGHTTACTCATGGTPVGPINAHLAGGTHPVTGVPFDSQGFPDFSAHRDPATPDVVITLTGDRKKDFAAADKAAGINPAYRKSRWTWNHHQNCGVMQLVSMSIHSKTGHTGGFSIC
ncbi:polymorphic toxin-type HINT domain-containing protein [Streptomyces showdoensis]|uniref:polymorphic toxin-type HINT domain-containing protein n=1 Tax=Streptomyces showdoensis TaxID=68268 RepID=UPI001F0A5F11|nr:polymorphic toxin-type HINT domain-containing protein [Streptomyces showdoensis]